MKPKRKAMERFPQDRRKPGHAPAFFQNAIGILTNLSFMKKWQGKWRIFLVFALLFGGEGTGGVI